MESSRLQRYNSEVNSINRRMLAVLLFKEREVLGFGKYSMVWRGVMAERYGECWLRDNLRMSHDTFEILCNELRPHLQKKDTTFRELGLVGPL